MDDDIVIHIVTSDDIEQGMRCGICGSGFSVGQQATVCMFPCPTHGYDLSPIHVVGCSQPDVMALAMLLPEPPHFN